MPSIKRRKSVALLIETSNAYARGLLEGIVQYQRKHDSWSIVLPEQERGATPPRWLQSWSGDGMIVRIENESIAGALAKVQMPIVDVSSARTLEGMPWVETDDPAIARMAYDHLRERGYTQFAFCGMADFKWSQYREEAFANVCDQHGLVCLRHQCLGGGSGRALPPSEVKRLTAWLKKLPKPIGLMAAYDIQAQIIVDVCRQNDILVPEQIAVLGVDNDPLLCNLATPPLSSVIPDAIGAGQLAAELLSRMMDSETVPPTGHFLRPLGVASRQSTDVYAVDDPMIAQAMRFIREHACDGINVEDVLVQVPLSRRMLESKFREATGKTPHEMIVHRRLARVAQLLLDTDLSQEEIARQAGFEYPEYMNTSFRRHYGVPPGQFRRNRDP